MNDFVTKPIRPELLYEKLLRWLDPEAVGKAAAAATEPVTDQVPGGPAEQGHNPDRPLACGGATNDTNSTGLNSSS